MNALNLLSSRVIGQSSSGTRPRSKSVHDEALHSKLSEEILRGRSYSEDKVARLSDYQRSAETDIPIEHPSDGSQTPVSEVEDEKQPLLGESGDQALSSASGLRHLIKKIADALTALLSTIGLPVVYVAAYFKDEDGHYSPLIPFRRKRRSSNKRVESATTTLINEKVSEKPANHASKLRRQYSSESLSSTTSESDNEPKDSVRRKLPAVRDDSRYRRQSARIKLLHSEEVVQRRRRKSNLSEKPMNADSTPLTVDSLKSPTGSTASSTRLHKYPHVHQPPRPLVPRRMPSHSNLISRVPSRSHSSGSQQKTLVLDLDETLIHSMAKGGRMSSGHMVEVKLNVPVSVAPAQTGQQPPTVLGPQHPILYYVHKRPHCDEFLRKISKWYRLVVFTASVQEYADPVINWLESERKYFSKRYYRQHCTFRNGSYVKDLGLIEPDLSKVMILDNSPISYAFHEDNAVPIEGWINDPTDNDLLHLIPLFEALQYVNDVRALLALRRGEAEAA